MRSSSPFKVFEIQPTDLYRNINRILTSASVTKGVISYKDSGRLLCESEVLLRQISPVLGGRQYAEFREDIQDLLDIQGGVEKQLKVVDRIQWTYFSLGGNP